jgi:DNA polymerase elongation subunit (family B)
MSGKEEICKYDDEELQNYLKQTNVSIGSNGVLYRMDKEGLIPAILSQWYNTRVEYRKLAKQFHEEGNEQQFQYYDRRQYLQKILLNSLYGVLGLPVFRFYDVDNAEATTLTGQELIKFSKKLVNLYYNKELGTTDVNYVIYIDTDSIFASATPLVKSRHKGIDTNAEATMTQHILNIADEIQGFLNNSYDLFANKFLNLDKHYFEIKQEVIAKSAFFVVKKRYGMKIINDSGRKVNKIQVKGLDTVRSSFAKAMKNLLSEVLDDILVAVPKEKIDERIFTFKKAMKAMNFDEIASPTGVKRVDKFKCSMDRETGLPVNVPGGKMISTYYEKATPVHVKASMAYNDMIDYYKIKRYPKISNGEKIKWVYLKQNPLNLPVLAYKGYDDPAKILEYIKIYIDVNKMYKQALSKKIDMFYQAMSWDKPVDKRYTLEKFF